MKTATLTLFNIKHMTLIVAVMCMLLSSLFIAPQKTESATNAEMVEQVRQLLEVVALLQAQLADLSSKNSVFTDSGHEASNIAVGIKIYTTAPLNIRRIATTKGTIQGVQPAHASGVVVAGPVYSNGYTWWKIDFLTGPDGWNAGNWLSVNKQIDTGNVITAILEMPSTAVAGESVKIRAIIENSDWDPDYQHLLYFGEDNISTITRDNDTTASVFWNYIYSKPGTYTVSLTYTNLGSADSSDKIYAEVLKKDLHNERNTILKQHQIVVVDPEDGIPEDETPECALTIDKEKVAEGESFTVTWSTKNISNPKLNEVLTTSDFGEGSSFDTSRSVLKTGSKTYQRKEGTHVFAISGTGIDIFDLECGAPVVVIPGNETMESYLEAEGFKKADAAIKSNLDSSHSNVERYHYEEQGSYEGACELPFISIDSAQFWFDGTIHTYGIHTKSLILSDAQPSTWETVQCHDSPEAWVTIAPLMSSTANDASMYCVDSTGWAGNVTKQLSANSMSCPSE